MTLEQILGSEAVNEIKGRAFGIDPNSSYDPKEFAKSADDLFAIDNYYRKLNQHSDDMNALKGIMSIALKYMPGDKEKNIEILRYPYIASEQARLLLDFGYRKMAGFAENNLNEMLNALPKEKLEELAMDSNIPDEDKKYLQLMGYIQAKDIESAKKMLAGEYKDEANKAKVMNFDGKRAEAYLKDYLIYLQDEFKQNRLCHAFKLESKDGKEEISYVFDAKKAQDYVKGKISKLKPEKRIPAYMQLAKILNDAREDKKEYLPESSEEYDLPLAA